jgi:hypothetical protein
MSSLTWKDTGREWVPLVHRVLLQPSTETIVKDISSMADDTWTYKDFLVSSHNSSLDCKVVVHFRDFDERLMLLTLPVIAGGRS